MPPVFTENIMFLCTLHKSIFLYLLRST
uniref:Uncharacterized protein n=1 Tax=Arundo donax TaxID=35708 RepID=A0A0A8YNI0_ARUDO